MKRWISAILQNKRPIPPRQAATPARTHHQLHPDDDFFGADADNSTAAFLVTPLLADEETPSAHPLAKILVPAESATDPANDAGATDAFFSTPETCPGNESHSSDIADHQDENTPISFDHLLPAVSAREKVFAFNDDECDLLDQDDTDRPSEDSDLWSDLDERSQDPVLQQSVAYDADWADWPPPESEDETAPIHEQEWQINKNMQQLALLLPFVRVADRDAGVEKLRALLRDFPASTSYTRVLINR